MIFTKVLQKGGGGISSGWGKTKRRTVAHKYAHALALAEYPQDMEKQSGAQLAHKYAHALALYWY